MGQLNMKYIVLDLEWNQCPSGKKYENPRLPFEIIEIGAVRLDENFCIEGKFNRIIKPQVYKSIHYMTRQVINLTMNDLKEGLSFTEAIKEFMAWCGDDYVFCTWGSTDVTELLRNMKFYGLEPVSQEPLKYYDIQKLFSLRYDDGKIKSNLKLAVERLGIEESMEYHSAFNDAWYTVQVMLNMDFESVKANYSIDCFYIPHSRQDEVYAVFDNYSKYISRGFASREEMLKDREVTSMKCYKCGKRCRKKIRWFSGNNKTYYALAICNEHGLLKGKIRTRQSIDDEYYAIKTLKLVTAEESTVIKDRQLQMRQKRRLKREREKLKRTEEPESL